jgi:hypothetical protein
VTDDEPELEDVDREAQLREWGNLLLEETRRYFRRRPLEGAVIALLTGGVLCLLLRRSR